VQGKEPGLRVPGGEGTVDADDRVRVASEHVIHELEDVIHELEWEGPARWAPVIERLRPLVAQVAERAGADRDGGSGLHPGEGPSGPPG
jgi:hypothetical protein